MNSDSQSAAETPAPTGNKKGARGSTRQSPAPLLLPVILTAQFVTPLAIAGVAVGLPSISADLGTDSSQLQGVVNAFNATFAIFTLIWGFISDRLGHARTFIIGVILCVVASAASMSATSLIILDLARAFAGVGAAAIITSASALISRRFHGSQRVRAFAIFGTINGLGLALGPSIAGGIISVGGWRAVFAAHGLLLLVSLAGSHALRSSSESSTQQPFDDDRPRPRPRPRALLHPGYLAMLVIPVAGAAGFVTLLTYLPAALQAVQNMAPGTAGLIMLAMTLPVLIAPTIVHGLRQRVDTKKPGRGDTVEAIVCTVALICLVLAPLGLLGFSPATPLPYLVVIMILAGLGFGLPLGIVDGRALSFIPDAAQGLAAGVLNFFRIGSEALFVALYALMLTVMISRQPSTNGIVDQISAGQPGHAQVYAAAMPPVLWAIAGCCTLLLLVYAFLSERARQGRAHTATR